MFRLLNRLIFVILLIIHLNYDHSFPDKTVSGRGLLYNSRPTSALPLNVITRYLFLELERFTLFRVLSLVHVSLGLLAFLKVCSVEYLCVIRKGWVLGILATTALIVPLRNVPAKG